VMWPAPCRRALANIAIFVDLFAAVPSNNASAPAAAPAAPSGSGAAARRAAAVPGAALAAPPAAGPQARRRLRAAPAPAQAPYVDLGITFDFFKSLQLPTDAPARPRRRPPPTPRHWLLLDRLQAGQQPARLCWGERITASV